MVTNVTCAPPPSQVLPMTRLPVSEALALRSHLLAFVDYMARHAKELFLPASAYRQDF